MATSPRTMVEVVMLSEELEKSDLSEDLVEEYAAFIGIDLEHERDLFWIARAGVEEPLPAPWKACQIVGTEDIFYFNTETQDSAWDHPCDEIYTQLLAKERKLRVTVALTLDCVVEAQGLRIQATNLAGSVVASAVLEAADGVAVADICDQLEAQLTLPDKATARFLLRSGAMLGYSSRARPVAEIFDLP